MPLVLWSRLAGTLRFSRTSRGNASTRREFDSLKTEMRCGEAIRLRLGDVDPDAGQVAVRRTPVTVGDSVEWSRNSRRMDRGAWSRST